MTPVRIEAFGKDGKILEAKEEMINGFDGIYIKLWLGKSEMQVKREMVPIDVPPQIVYDRTMVPIRAIADGFDAETTWINETKTIIIEFGSTRILLPLGSKISTVNGQDVTLDVAAQVINGRALVPIRFIIEAFGAEITWFAAERSIEIRK
ncbi:MAG: copper amine oxidase N-terminal domain-containing protein [Caldisericia bacterium]